MEYLGHRFVWRHLCLCRTSVPSPSLKTALLCVFTFSGQPFTFGTFCTHTLTCEMDNVLILAFAMLHVSLSTTESFLYFHYPGPWRLPKPSRGCSQGPGALVCALGSSVPPDLGPVVSYYLINSLLLLHKFKTYIFLNPEILVLFSERLVWST